MVAEDVRGVIVDEPEELAWIVLRTVNQMQAKGSTARIVVPRDPEVAYELDVAPTDDELLSAEEYLLDHDFLVPVDIGLTRGSYSVTPVGLDWLGRSSLSSPRAPETVAEGRDGAGSRPGTGGAREDTDRSSAQEKPVLRTWWRRVIGR